MVIAGIGVDHDQLVESVQRHFVDSAPSWRTDTKVISDQSVAQYTGGLDTLEKDMSNVSLGPTPMPELGHLVIGLESVGHHHEVSGGDLTKEKHLVMFFSGLYPLLCTEHDDGRRGELLRGRSGER